MGSTAPQLRSAIVGPRAVYRFGPNYVDLEKGIGLYLLNNSFCLDYADLETGIGLCLLNNSFCLDYADLEKDIGLCFLNTSVGHYILHICYPWVLFRRQLDRCYENAAHAQSKKLELHGCALSDVSISINTPGKCQLRSAPTSVTNKITAVVTRTRLLLRP